MAVRQATTVGKLFVFVEEVFDGIVDLPREVGRVTGARRGHSDGGRRRVVVKRSTTWAVRVARRNSCSGKCGLKEG